METIVLDAKLVDDLYGFLNGMPYKDVHHFLKRLENAYLNHVKSKDVSKSEESLSDDVVKNFLTKER